MSYVEIQAALEGRLTINNPVGGSQLYVHRENLPVDPIEGVSYLKSAFLPAEPFPAALGASAPNRCSGIFQVTVCAPVLQGRGHALEIAELVLANYPRGMKLLKGSTEVLIDRAGLNPGLTVGERYMLPVTIRWRSDQPN